MAKINNAEKYVARMLGDWKVLKHKLISNANLLDKDDEQLFYTEIYQLEDSILTLIEAIKGKYTKHEVRNGGRN